MGPLFATEAKAALPLFGPERLASKSTTPIVNAAVKKALESTANAVIDLAASDNSTKSNVAADTLSSQTERANFSKNGKDNIDGIDTFATAPSLLSSQELHDRSHYSSSTPASTPSKYNLMVNTMIRRAKEGYLLNSTLNKAIVQEDPWLHDVWEWIEGRKIPILLRSYEKLMLRRCSGGCRRWWNDVRGARPKLHGGTLYLG